jgi:hypothetical protein
MMMGDKKSALAAIMAARSASGPNMPSEIGSGEPEKSSDGMDSLSLTAKTAVDAIHAKDYEGFKDAMQDFHDLHSASRDENDMPMGPKDSGN